MYRVAHITQRIENQREKTMDNEMDTGFIGSYITAGIRTLVAFMWQIPSLAGIICKTVGNWELI